MNWKIGAILLIVAASTLVNPRPALAALEIYRLRSYRSCIS